MARNYPCPKCGHDIRPKDINVEKDILLCPSCGELSRFSEVTSRIFEAEDENARMRLLSAPPPKHLKIVKNSMDMTGRIVMTFRKVSPSVLFLIPFTALWSGFSLFSLYGSQIINRQFDLSRSLFGLPFLLGSICLIAMCLFQLFGKRVLTIERGKGCYFIGIGFLGIRRRFIFDRRTEICKAFKICDGGRGESEIELPELQLTHPDHSDTVHVCAGMSEDAIDYIEALVKREISRG